MNTLIFAKQVMIRELLVQSCAQQMPHDTVYSAGSRQSALAICRAHSPELVILDLTLPDRDCLDLIEQILGIHPEARIVAMLDRADECTLRRVPQAGVQGIVDKTEPLTTLHDAIASVTQGNRFISAAIQRLYVGRRGDTELLAKALSEREEEVLRLIGEGLTNGEIADELEISLCTAKHHRSNVMAKLNLHSTAKLMHYAVEKGITRMPEYADALS